MSQDLIGRALDAAVARALGYKFSVAGDELYVADVWVDGVSFRPSEDWSQGGPIIERERITIVASTGYGEPLFWVAACGEFAHYIDEPLYSVRNPCSSWQGVGPTPLVAAMRAFVASKA